MCVHVFVAHGGQKRVLAVSPEVAVTGSGELSDLGAENSGPVEEQQGSGTTELSHQPLSNFKERTINVPVLINILHKEVPRIY